MSLALAFILPVLFAAFMFRQLKKPSGFVGRLIVRQMYVSHMGLVHWGLEQFDVPASGMALDVGCGGGWLVRKVASLNTEGMIVGVDLSAASVAVAAKKNSADVRTGRVQLIRGSVTGLPFASESFDLVTACETHYYWPDLLASVREVRRVLRPGGLFVIIAETHRSEKSFLGATMIPLLSGALLSDAEHKQLLSEAGFSGVETRHATGRNWICTLGRRS